MSWEDALERLARPVGLSPGPVPPPLRGGAWYLAPWGALWAVPVVDLGDWRTRQDELAEALLRAEDALGLAPGTLEAWLVLVLPEAPPRRERQAAQLDTRVARKHVVWPGEEGWEAALGAVTCLGLPAAQPVQDVEPGDGWLAELAGATDHGRAAALRDRLDDVEAPE